MFGEGGSEGWGAAEKKWMHGLAQGGSRERKKSGESTGDFLLSTLSFYPSGNLVVIYCGLFPPGGMGGKWALNWVSMHHLLTVMLVVFECLHLMFRFKNQLFTEYLCRVLKFITANCSASLMSFIMLAPSSLISTLS